MGKWSFMELLTQEASQEDYEEIFLSPYEVEPSEGNFYSQENIEELADSMLAVGQQQPTVLAQVNGAYKIISGHRRNLANIHNIERGMHPADHKVRYLCKDMTPAMLELSLIIGNAFNRKLTPYEETEQAARLRGALIRARDEDGLEVQGKLRDIIADILHTSATQVARLDKINHGLIPEAKEQFKEGRLGKSAAYETSRLPEEEQKEIVAAVVQGQEISHKNIAGRVKEKAIEKAAERAEKAARRAEEAQIAAARAGLQAERAAENVGEGGAFTAAAMNGPEPQEEQEWPTREWAVYTLRELMRLASYIADDDIIVLQDILMAAKEKEGIDRGRKL